MLFSASAISSGETGVYSRFIEPSSIIKLPSLSLTFFHFPSKFTETEILFGFGEEISVVSVLF